MEHRMREEVRRADQGRGPRGRGAGLRGRRRLGRAERSREDPRHRVHVGGRGGFVERNADVTGARRVEAEVIAGGEGRLPDAVARARRNGQRERVEVGGVLLRAPQGRQAPGQFAREAVHPSCDPLEAGRAVVHAVHRRHRGQQRLRRADVRRGLVAPDVLLAGLQRHPEGAVALRVDRDADDAAWRLPDVLVARGEERRVRAAVAHRDAEALGAADDNVRAHLPGRGGQDQRQEIGGDGHERAGSMSACDDAAQVVQGTPFVRCLQQHAEDAIVEHHPVRVCDDEFDAERLRTARQDVERLRETPGRHHEHRFRSALHPPQHRHGLGGRGGLVEERRVGHRHAGEVLDDRLKGQQRLEAALRDLGLVRRVGRVPAGILEDVAQDDRRRHAVAVAEADERTHGAVVLRDPAEPAEKLVLAFRLER